MSGTGNVTSMSVCGLGDVIWLSAVIGPMCLLGYIGNTLCLLVLHRARNHSSVTIVLLKSLAASDLLYLLLYSIMKYWPRILPFMNVFAYLHVYAWPLVSMLFSMTTWLMVVLTSHRYMAVCHPLHARHRCTVSRARLHVAMVCCVAAVLDIPRFFEQRVLQHNGTAEVTLKSEPTWLFWDFHYNLLYKNTLMLVYRKLLPLAITITLTARIVRVLYVARRGRGAGMLRTESAPRQQQAEHPRITRVLLTVVLVFILCQTPGAVYPILRMSVDPRVEVCGTAYYYFLLVADGLTIVNSAVNFLIYMLCSAEFRHGFYALCGRGRGLRGRGRRGPVGVMSTYTLRQHRTRTSIDMTRCDRDTGHSAL